MLNAVCNRNRQELNSSGSLVSSSPSPPSPTTIRHNQISPTYIIFPDSRRPDFVFSGSSCCLIIFLLLLEVVLFFTVYSPWYLTQLHAYSVANRLCQLAIKKSESVIPRGFSYDTSITILQPFKTIYCRPKLGCTKFCL